MELMGINPDLLAYLNRHLRTAGWHAAQMRADVEIKTKNAADDFVTSADKELDAIISAALAKRLPDCGDFTDSSTLTDGLITEERIDQLAPPTALAVAVRKRVWYLDPIDGTDNYVKNDGEYCSMLGLIVDNQPVYGWIYAPARDELYFGGPPSHIAERFGSVGLWRMRDNAKPEALARSEHTEGHSASGHPRVIMGSRDRRDNPQMVQQLGSVEWVSVGSLGLKVIALVNNEADVYIHCSQQLKFWDTVAPIAVATAAGLTVCDLDGNPIKFNLHDASVTTQDIFRHRQIVLIGTSGGVAAVRQRLQSKNL